MPPERADAVLRARKSVRTFASRPVPASAIAAAVDAGIAADEELWPEENALGIDLELVLIAWSVDPLAPGVYVWEDAGFRFVGAPPERDAPGSVTLQRGLQAAPALLLASGNLLASGARHGDHGVFNGFQPAAARAIFGPSLARRQLLALALGYPADASPT
jgi:hypothetical protein